MNQTTLDRIAKIFADPNEAVDLTLFTAIGSFILQIIKGCSSPTAAAEQIKKGGPVAFGHAMQVVRQHTDLRGKAARLKAQELVKAGTEMTDQEITDMMSDAKDAPNPQPAVPSGIFQFGLIAVVLLFAGSAAIAQDQPAGIFQIDVEQNRRLDVLEKKVDDLTTTLKNLPRPASAQAAPTLANNGVGSAVKMPSVQAALAARSPAYEVINGVRTHTSDAHLMAHGWKPEDFAGLNADQKDWLHGAAHNAGIVPKNTVAAIQQTRTVATVNTAAGYAEVCNGRRCRRLRLH